MSQQIPYFYRDEGDGSRYEVDVILDRREPQNTHWDVDLVRHSVTAKGLPVEQRLTLNEYDRRSDADNHRDLIEDQIETQGLESLGEAQDKILAEPFYYQGELMQNTAPQLDDDYANEGTDRSREEKTLTEPLKHVDGGGTAHWFDVAERETDNGISHELRYFRELNLTDGTQFADSYPVMPLPDADKQNAWPVQGLEMYLNKGNVYMAQQLAHDVADSYGQEFPEPHEMPALDPRPEYYFGYGASDRDMPALEFVKTWMDGAERRFDTLTIAEYGSFDEAAMDEKEFSAEMEQYGVQAGANIAESLAMINGLLDENRDDPRLFFENDAPADPFTTMREQELIGPNYEVGAISANGESFLDVTKTWGTDEYERLVIPQEDWETAQAVAQSTNILMQRDNLQDAMRLVELTGISAGVIDPDREDTRLFTQGPPDPFTTYAEQLRDEINPYWNVERTEPEQPDIAQLEDSYHRLDVREVQGRDNKHLGYAVVASAYPQLPADFDDTEMDDTLYPTEAWALDVRHFNDEQKAKDFLSEHKETPLSELTEDAVSAEWEQWDMHDVNRFMAGRPQRLRDEEWQPEQEIPSTDWRFEQIAVNDPEGEPLGQSLNIITGEGQTAKMLEVAHFETHQQADKFVDEFTGYLMPGVLEAPELAQEVARLEGHSAQWQMLDAQTLSDIDKGEFALTHDVEQWKQYNPNAEREARIEAEFGNVEVDIDF